MPLSTEDAVREVYRIAIQENLKKELRTEAEFDRYTDILQTHALRMDSEIAAFRDHYQDRLVKAEEAVMREQSGRFLDHPKPSWADDAVMSGDRIEVLAHNRVLADHELRKQIIRTDEIDAYKALSVACRARAAQEREQHREQRAQSLADRKGRARDAFAITQEISPHEAQTQGRSGPSRS